MECLRSAAAQLSIGCGYVGRVCLNAGVAFLFGFVIIVLPLAVLLNMAAEATGPSGVPGHATSRVVPEGWTAHDVAALDSLPFYLFWAYQTLNATISMLVPIFSFLLLWRGREVALRWPLAVMLPGSLAFGAVAFLRWWLLAEGRVASQNGENLLRLIVYTSAFHLGLGVLLSSVPKGKLRQLGLPCCAILGMVNLTHACLGPIFAMYTSQPTLYVKTVCLGLIYALRSVGLAVVFFALDRIPELTPEAKVLWPWLINLFTLGALQIMQTVTPDLSEATLIFMGMALSEAFRHVLYLRFQKTEFSLLLAALRRLRLAVRQDPVVAAHPVVIAGSQAPAKLGRNGSQATLGGSSSQGVSSMEMAAAAWGRMMSSIDTTLANAVEAASEANARYRTLMAGLVEATNVTDFVIILVVAAVFLIVRVNPLDARAGPWPWEKTLATAAVALAFEALTDFVVAVLCEGSRDPLAVYGLSDAAKEPQSCWRFAKLFMAVALTTETLVTMSVYLCPQIAGGADGLVMLGPCRA